MPTRRFCLKFTSAAMFAWLFGIREPKQVVASESLQIKLDANAGKISEELKQKIDREVERVFGPHKGMERRLPEVEWELYDKGRSVWHAMLSNHWLMVEKHHGIWEYRVLGSPLGEASSFADAKRLAIEKCVELIESDYRKLQEMLK